MGAGAMGRQESLGTADVRSAQALGRGGNQPTVKTLQSLSPVFPFPNRASPLCWSQVPALLSWEPSCGVGWGRETDLPGPNAHKNTGNRFAGRR